MADKELAAKLQKRLASLELDSEEDPDTSSKIPAAPPPPPENFEPAPYLINEQFADIDKLINDTLRYTESQEMPVWKEQSPVIHELPVETSTASDSTDLPQVLNPAGKCAPVMRIVHHKGFTPQKPLSNMEARLEKVSLDPILSTVIDVQLATFNSLGVEVFTPESPERNELEAKLAKQREKKTADPPDILEGIISKSNDHLSTEFNNHLNSAGDVLKSMDKPKKKTPFDLRNEVAFLPTSITDIGLPIKSPPPTPKKPKFSLVSTVSNLFCILFRNYQ
uniref:WH2 domain-containing protein n=1 Tax=Parascaris equorum TaxID=6256 RepID=A0A914R613_PAREQ